MKIGSIVSCALVAVCLFLSNGCSKAAGNVITVSVTPTTSLILGQSVTMNATVNGATNTNVMWTPQYISGKPPCQYTTTPSGGKTSALTNCPTDGSFGTLTNLQATGTATYTAPSNLPLPKTYPSLVISICAQSVQNTSKSGCAKITLISGITVVLNPATASVPTKEVQQFNVLLTNDLKSAGVTWLLTQNVPNTNSSGTFLNYPQLPTCSPSCGTITPSTNDPTVATYTAPSTVPTAITPAQKNNSNLVNQVTIVATSAADTTEFTIGTIAVVSGGPITFNGISPSIAPQGATLWDIYLNAPNISSSSRITLTGPGIGVKTKDSTSGQVKILFPLPTTSTSTTTTTAACNTTTSTSANACSTGARLRLFASDLIASGPVTVTITDPVETVTQCSGNPLPQGCTVAGTFIFNVIPVRPTSTASVPNDVVQGKLSQDTPVIIDGGYFGPNGNLAAVFFEGNNGSSLSPQVSSTSRQLDALFPAILFNSQPPGLYTLSVDSRANPAPAATNPSVTNIALFPDYSTTPPNVCIGPTCAGTGIPVGTNSANSNPTAMDMDPTLGVLVVAEAGSSTAAPPVVSGVQFYAIGKGALTPIDSTGATCATACPVTGQTFPNVSVNIPTGISVNRVNHTAAIVNYGDQTVTVLPIPVPGAASQTPAPGTPFTVSLPPAAQAAQGMGSAPPVPYSIGVDPDSNLAIVAYSSTTASAGLNLGYVVNLNPNSGTNPYGCPLTDALTGLQPATGPVGQCLFAQVTLNTGTYPQIAVAPHGHLAVVTPGGSGVVRGVDVTHQSSSNVIKSATLTAGLVTVTVDTTLCPPGVSPTSNSKTNPCPLLMVPGNAGTVLIANVKPGTSANNVLFNGVFSVSVLSSNSFSYSVPNTTASDSGTGECDSNTKICAEVFYGTPDQTFPITSTAQGVAINPVTHTAAIADANATGQNGAQIWLLNSLDQSTTSYGFSANCTAFIPSCPSSAELLPTADVAWQPFTNELVSYNPHLNQVSISDPVSRQRYGFACEVNNGTRNNAGTSCITNPSTAPSSVCPSVSPPISCQQMFLNQITLSGSGMSTIHVQNGNTNTLTLFGGVTVDPDTNQVFVLESGSGTIDIVNLNGATPIKPSHVSEVIVPSATPGPGVIGGVPNALVPQATLTSTTDLAGVQIFGTGFDSTTQVLLDGTSIPQANVQVNSPRQLTATIPAALLGAPHHYALQVATNNIQSNAIDFIVVQAVDLSKVCTASGGGATNTMPTSVALADQIANGVFSPIALVSITGCNSVVVLDMNPTVTVGGQVQPNPNLGHFIGSPVTVGTSPQGIAISQPLGLAVVANNGDGTASVLDLTPLPAGSPVQKVPAAATGTNPTGVGIDDATGAAIVANTGSNTVSLLNLATLFPNGSTAAATSLTPVSIGGIQQPLAVAIDPDRGTNNQGIAVVTSVQLAAGSAPTGSLSVVEIGFATPILSQTISSGFVSGTPTGIVFDPTVVTGTTNQGAFYANSSGTNTITEFNPDTGGGSSVSVGINPTSLAVNPQTGAILTSNSASNTISIVDTLSSPFRTLQTLGFPGSATLGVAIDQFTNLAVIVDQANMRVLIFAMPN